MENIKKNRPDPVKAFNAIARILNARENGVKVELKQIKRRENTQ